MNIAKILHEDYFRERGPILIRQAGTHIQISRESCIFYGTYFLIKYVSRVMKMKKIESALEFFISIRGFHSSIDLCTLADEVFRGSHFLGMIEGDHGYMIPLLYNDNEMRMFTIDFGGDVTDGKEFYRFGEKG